MKLHQLVTNREFKLLIKPDGLDRRSRITSLSDQIVQFCKKSKVEFFHIDNAGTGLRNIYFYDTPGEDFRQNNIILRIRESRQNVWVDDWCEVTLKCRTHDIEQSSKFNPAPADNRRYRDYSFCRKSYSFEIFCYGCFLLLLDQAVRLESFALHVPL